jgi:hypothetical protein
LVAGIFGGVLGKTSNNSVRDTTCLYRLYFEDLDL